MIRRTLLLALLTTLTTAEACGPDFFPDVFVRTNRPDLPRQFVQGNLGILQTDFPSADLFVAYRYLTGGTLSKDEQEAWQPTYSIAEQDYDKTLTQQPYQDPPINPAIAHWAEIRARYTNTALATVDPTLQVKSTTPQGYDYKLTVTNCADDAFQTAAHTLEARAATWGTNSPNLADWIAAQDAVFLNCSKENAASPKSAPTNAPQLLQQDRAYQTAAASFYSNKLDQATTQFDTIAADKASPWSATAGYVAGRALLRKAFLEPVATDAPAGYNKAALLEAQHHIDRYLATKPPKQWAQAAELQRNLIRIRLEPEARTRELAAALTGPAADSNYDQDVQDTLWLLRNQLPDGFRAQLETYEAFTKADGTSDYRILTQTEAQTRANKLRNQAFLGSAKLREAAPILDWTITLRALSPANADHALQQWQATRTLPWLVAALMLAPSDTPPSAALLEAAANIPTTSPAYQTVAYHRARLQLAAHDAAAARATLTTLQTTYDAQPADQQQPSTRNALRSLTAQAADTSNGFLANLSQHMLLSASQASQASVECTDVMTHRSNWHHCLQPGGDQLDSTAARILNQQAPLTLWIEAANSPDIPKPLREAIAMQGFTRSTLVGNTAAATAFKPLLPQPLQQQLTNPSPLTAWIALARNPGLQPNLDAGTQRAYTYDFVESYSDNWCYNPPDSTLTLPAATAITPQDRAEGQAEAKAVSTLRSVDVGNRIIAAVAANPRDPRAPESLYLVLRMIRYGCNPVADPNARQQAGTLTDQLPDRRTATQLLKLRRDTGALMRRYYATNQWTKKATPFVGN